MRFRSKVQSRNATAALPRTWGPALLLSATFAIGTHGMTAALAAEAQGPRVTGSEDVAAAVNQYCSGCHSETARIGGLVLEGLNPGDVGPAAETWEKVVRKLSVRAMPPAAMPRPDEETYVSLIGFLEESLDAAFQAAPDPGRTETFRRLNRTEYGNAIRDLLALDIDTRYLLPADDASYGFDNVGVAGLSPTLMERYLAAAQQISRLAVGRAGALPEGRTFLLPPDLTQDHHIEGLPFGTRGGGLVAHNFPRDGEYEIQVRLTRNRDEQVEGLLDPHDLEVALDGERIALFTLPVSNGQGNPDADLNVRVPVSAGPHEIAAAFLKRPSVLAETLHQPYHASFEFVFHRRTQPAVRSVSVHGPFEAGDPGDTPSRRRIFTCRPASSFEEAGCARSIISTLARRAYRRGLSDLDMDRLMGFYEEASRGEGFEGGIETALRAILSSPDFLFRIEQAPDGVEPGTSYRVSGLDLATRLSLFLWSSIPDDELLDAALRGDLDDPVLLESQVRRMLGDARASALVNNFAGQWLQLRNLESVTPDLRTFPDFDDNLRQAFRRETELLFETVIQEDRTVLDLLDANYTFLNERLAQHYGIPNIYGSHFRRVELAPGTVRGGLFGQGSILTVTSYATRTSPVLRGKWLLENVLGMPPPPPPPDVPALETNAEGGRNLSMRDLMAQHRAAPVCASCHATMDPAGLAMENFDAVGRWRSNDRGNMIDASGSLPGGLSFEGVTGLRQVLLEHPELFVRTLTEKLLTYALGRGLEFYDAPAVRKILRQAAEDEYRFSSVVLGVVGSTPFQMRRSAP